MSAVSGERAGRVTVVEASRGGQGRGGGRNKEKIHQNLSAFQSMRDRELLCANANLPYLPFCGLGPRAPLLSLVVVSIFVFFYGLL